MVQYHSKAGQYVWCLSAKYDGVVSLTYSFYTYCDDIIVAVKSWTEQQNLPTPPRKCNVHTINGYRIQRERGA